MNTAFPTPDRRSWSLCGVSLVAGLLMSNTVLCGQQAATLSERITLAREKAREAREAQDSATRHLKFAEAADLGIAMLEAFPDSQWEPAKLESFVMDMGYGWLSKLPKTNQEAWLAKHASAVRSPSGHLVVGFIEWQVGRRSMALARAAHILSAAPNSSAAGAAMWGILASHYFRGDLKSAGAAIRSFIKIAPNNRRTASALCGYTWAMCGRRKPREAHEMIKLAVESGPGTVTAQMGGKLKTVLDAIGARDYAGAIGVLETFEIDYWKEAVLNDLVLTFVALAGNGSGQQQLIESMTEIAAGHADPAPRALAKCIKGRALRSQRQDALAIDTYEEVLRETQNDPNPLIRLAFDAFLHGQLGAVLLKHDVDRAIVYLERFRAKHGKTDGGGDFYTIKLGCAYIKAGEASKAHEVFAQLDDRRKNGRIIADKELKGAIRSGLVASLDKLGRKDEADALADELLAPHGYGQAASSLKPNQRSRIATLLGMMGRDVEAKHYRSVR